MINLTQKQVTTINDRYRDYKKNNPDGKKTFIDFRREFIKEIEKKNILKAKKEYQKNGRKIKSLVKAGKVI